MKRLILILIAFFVIVVLKAQTDFRPGYILKNEKDTLFGEVDYQNDISLSKICSYRASSTDTVHHYYPGQIFGFRFNDSKFFISKMVDGNDVFLEFLIKGKFNVYYLKKGIDSHYFFDKENVPLTELPYSEGVKMENNVKYSYTSTNHIGLLTYYMQDAPKLADEIQSIKKPDHKNLIKLATDYHYVVCDGEKCITYEKKIPAFKINPELVGGLFLANISNPDNQLNLFQFGVVGHVWMPRVDERYYFKTGLIFLSAPGTGIISPFTKIPFQFEYQYPKGIFRPRIGFGLNFYNFYIVNMFSTLTASPGCMLKLSKNIYLTLNYDFELAINYNAIMPLDRFSTEPIFSKFTDSLYGGLYFSF
ncbi:MAG: hypothetical protein PHS84_09005 [Paludibacter sp.]|nr:hypothetical protein [Paludibacter sp.]